MGDFSAASSAFQRGLALEPNNPNLTSGLEQAQARLPNDSPASRQDDDAPSSGAEGESGMPDLSAMANMLGGTGRGAGGMPDLSGMMNNPAIMQMAQNMMANGGMERLMQNPALAGMVQCDLGLPSDLLADSTHNR